MAGPLSVLSIKSVGSEAAGSFFGSLPGLIAGLTFGLVSGLLATTEAQVLDRVAGPGYGFVFPPPSHGSGLYRAGSFRSRLGLAIFGDILAVSGFVSIESCLRPALL